MTYPLSQTQMGIYVTCMNSREEGGYNIDLLYSLDAGIDLDRLAKALDAVVEAHPYIKSRLVVTDNGEVAFEDHTADAYHTTISVIDSLAEVSSHIGADYDLMNDPLFRLEIYRTKSGQNYLYVDFHHIIFDGMSLSAFYNDLAKAYDGDPLEKEPVSGFEIALKEKEERASKAYEEAAAWYEQEFGAAAEIDSLPLPDVDGQQEEHFTLESHPLVVDKEALAALCQKAGVKESSVFSAAFGYTLSRFTGDEEVLYSTIFHGRTDRQTRSSYCMMVKTLPVYHNMAATPSVVGLLQQTSRQMAGCRQHLCYSYGDMSTRMGIHSDVSFAYHGNVYPIGITLDGRSQPTEYLVTHTPGFKLLVQVKIENGAYTIYFDYANNRYSKSFIEIFLHCYNHVLNGMVAKERLCDIDLLDEDQQKTLDAFNRTECDYDNTQTIPSLFRKAAALYPDNECVAYDGRTYTYKEVDDLSDRIAWMIHEKGIGREQVVSVLIPRSEYMAIASLGVSKVGAAYQPLDPTYPEERLNFMMKDAAAQLLICDRSLRTKVNEYDGDVVYLDELASLPETDTEQRRELLAAAPCPEDLFIMLYTSGSTGVPKGCQIEQRNIVAFCHWYQREYQLTAECRAAAYASYGFDANMMDTWPTLTIGAAVHIIPEEMRMNLLALNDYFEANRVTHALMTTQVGRQFATEISNRSLRHLNVGGEKLVPCDPPAHYTLHNAYGPTECTIVSTSFAVDRLYSNVPIGRPVDNMKAYVIDRQKHLLPVGAPGELCLAGPQVSRGYLNRPEQTAKAYEPNPFSDVKGYERIYHTGDIVRWLPDGNIEFVGRKDAQVKIRGFRIELTEVEAVIREYPPIKDATVQAFDDPNGGKFICAYIVSDEKVDVAGLNAFIAERKPPYMVPAVTMQIDKIPLNQNQKVNKRALPQPERKAESRNEAPAAPLNRLEQAIMEVVAGVVQTDAFGITEPLAYVGLTSISSIRLATLLYKRFGVEIDVKQLIGGGTLQSIENEILDQWMKDDAAEAPKPSEEAPADQAPATEVLAPLTYPQLGVFLDCMKQPSSTLYNVPVTLRLPAGTEVRKLVQAVKDTVANHQSLHLLFTYTDGQPRQKLAVRGEAEVPVLEMTADRFKDYCHDFIRPFNLSEGPLYRFAVVKEVDEQRAVSAVYLMTDIHHLVTDGASDDLLLREILARLDGQAVEAEDYSYLQFAADQQAAEGGEEYEKARLFFDGRLSRCEGASVIASDLPQDPEALHTLGTCRVPVDMAAAEALAKRLGVTPMSIFLAATYYTVCRYVNSKEVFLGTISNGRRNLRTYNTTGMFVNTLALSSVVGEQSVSQFVEQTARDFNDTVAHEQYPFARIAADYGFAPDIVFEYQVGVMADYAAGGQRLDFVPMTLDLAKFKLKVVVVEGEDGGYQIQTGYDEAVYSAGLAQRIAESVSAVVSHFTAAPEAPVKSVSIMSEGQRKEVEALHTVAVAPVEYDRFFEPLEHYAATCPDRTALIASDRTLTYAEFNREANRLAHALLARGVKRGDRIVVLLPRTSAVLLSFYAISKAGAAFIPCDPAYPADRIRLITEDSDAAYVLTTADHLAEHGGKALLVDELLAYEADGCLDNPEVKVAGDDLVYLIYTSGSTGRPKGVMITHRGICNYLQNHPANRHVHVMATEGHCYLGVTTLSFDMSLKEYGVSFANGLTFVLADEDQSNNPIELARLFRETGADIINATPSRLLNYMELPDFSEALRRCQCVLSGGEAYSDQLLTRLKALQPKHIFNTYGPTEITVSSNCKELTRADRISIGRPLLNYTEFVVDADGNELPVGVVGELYIGGDVIAKGYHHLDRQTRERFVDYHGVRCYRSGDYARWTEEGDIVTLGRMDHQIKLRGLRIELGEVEAAATKVSGVKQAVVMVKTIDGTDHLCAYYTAGRAISIDEMKSEMGRTLTHYMVPTAFLQLEAFPLTPNGKVDVKHLPLPQLAAVGGDYVAPKNAVEETFCRIFGDILGLDRVSAADSFFDLGGTSLTVTRVMIEAQDRGFGITYADVFKHTTPQQLAALAGSGKEEETDSVDHEVADYDYTAINALLAGNRFQSFRHGERLQLGNVLLTGATGYLGIHVLHDLIEHHLAEDSDCCVWCLVRHERNGVDSESRLRNLLYYYFEDSYDALFGTRLKVIDGDVTAPEVFDQAERVDTVINCAAIVKHFSEGTEIEDINIGGLKNCLDYCLRTGAKLVQTSTFSISGQSVNGCPDPSTSFSEQMLYFGQELNSKYTRSKFLAERMVLEAVAEKGLVAKIVRLGNLAPRAADGEFQINFRSNSAMGRLHVYQMLGAYSYSIDQSQMEFSPIDEVAQAVLLLATTPKECVVFHPFNHHMQFVGDVVREMAETLEADIRLVEDEEFEEVMHTAAQDQEKAQVLQSFLAYKAGGNAKVAVFKKYNPYTIRVLSHLGFHWNVTSWDYVQRFIEAIAAFGFFEDRR